MQYVTDSGYTQSVQLATHPNGTLLFGYRHNEEGATREGKRYVVRALLPNGQWQDLGDVRSERDFIGALGDCSVAVLPDGRVAVGLAAGMANRNVQAALDFLPGRLPPFGQGASYSFPVGATDTEARRIASEAKAAAQQTVSLTADVLRQVADAGKKAEAAAKSEVAAFIARQQAAAPAFDANKAADIAWSKAGERLYAEATSATATPLQNVIWDKAGARIYDEARNPQSPLMNFARQQAAQVLDQALRDAESPAGVALRQLIAREVAAALAKPRTADAPHEQG